MILAAGLGTRLQPLSELCAKPAMPVRNIPVIAHTLALLARHDVDEVIINLHHLPDTVRSAVERHCPDGVTVHYSYEPVLLGTGGGMRAVAEFLRESDPSLVLAGDMLLDVDLGPLVARHRQRGDRYTLLLLDGDPRQQSFGTIGTDDEDCVRRIGSRLDLGGETRAGLFAGVRVVASRCLCNWPSQESFEDLSDWLGPSLSAGSRDIRGHWISSDACIWEPVGTPLEYLSVNLEPPPLSYLSDLPERSDLPGRPERMEPEPAALEPEARATTPTEAPPHSDPTEGRRADVVVGAGAQIEPGARLRRVVVWPGERVPSSTNAQDGVFAGGRFHECGRQTDATRSLARSGGKQRGRPQPG
jgi:NDP-sugar pyrophosphorylase family protein